MGKNRRKKSRRGGGGGGGGGGLEGDFADSLMPQALITDGLYTSDGANAEGGASGTSGSDTDQSDASSSGESSSSGGSGGSSDSGTDSGSSGSGGSGSGSGGDGGGPERLGIHGLALNANVLHSVVHDETSGNSYGYAHAQTDGKSTLGVNRAAGGGGGGGNGRGRNGGVEKGAFKAFFDEAMVALRYVNADIRKDRTNFVVGVITVVLVVMFVGFLQNVVERSPIVFVRLAENQVGTQDLALTAYTFQVQTEADSGLADFQVEAEAAAEDTLLEPLLGTSLASFFVNATYCLPRLDAIPSVRGAAPRWIQLVTIRNVLPDELLGLPFEDHEWTSVNASAIAMVIDTDLENELDIGRNWDYRKLGKDEVHLTGSVMRRLGVKENSGEKIEIVVDIIALLESFGVVDSDADAEALFEELVAELLDVDSLDAVSGEELIAIVEEVAEAQDATATAELITALIDPDGVYNITAAVDAVFETSVRDALVFTRNVTVVSAIEDVGLKYGSSLGNVMVMEAEFLQALADEFIDDLLSGALLNTTDGGFSVTGSALDDFDLNVNVGNLTDTLRGVNVYDYATTVLLMYEDRWETYQKDLKHMQLDMIALSNEVAEALGVQYPVTVTVPIATTLEALYFVKLFLQQLFNFVIVIEISLGCVLIYSLQMADVDEKTFEYGMLRSLGMEKRALVVLICVKAVYFALPGVALGLFFGWLLFIPVSLTFSSIVYTPLDLAFRSQAVLVAVVIGLLMPLVANLIPIRRALGRSLRDAMDIYHQSKTDVSVTIMKLQDIGLSPWQVAVSIIMVTMGFIVYYLIPYSFTFNNLELFFAIMIGILLGMVLGLCLVAQTVQGVVQQAFLWCMVWGNDRKSLLSIAQKNLSSHGARNLKTSMMYTVSVAFIIFSGTVFTLEGESFVHSVYQLSGSDIAVYASSFDNNLDESDLRTYLDAEVALHAEHGRASDSGGQGSAVTGYTFITYSMSYYSVVDNLEVSNLAAFRIYPLEVVGVERNYLDETFSYYYRPTEVNAKLEDSLDRTEFGDPDAIHSLYDNAGAATLSIEAEEVDFSTSVISNGFQVNEDALLNSTEARYASYVDIIVSEAFREPLSIDTDTPMKLWLNYDDAANYTSSNYLVKAQAMISGLPGFFYSSYRGSAFFTYGLVSMDRFQELMERAYTVNTEYGDIADTPRKERLMVRLVDGATRDEREAVMNGILNFIDDDLTFVLDTESLVDTTRVTVDLLNVFFIVVATVSIVLCFFMLWLSFTANVKENSWEFGVLRSIGLTSVQIIRVYVYEALSVVMSSVFLGSAIGIATATTLTLQFNIFTELPFKFIFPSALFLFTVAMSLVVAVAGSYMPSRKLKRKEIALALRNL